MWPFNKAEKKVLEIPAEEVLPVLERYDAYQSLPKGSDSVAKYALWKRIERSFPEVHEGNWEIVRVGTRVYIKEFK